MPRLHPGFGDIQPTQLIGVGLLTGENLSSSNHIPENMQSVVATVYFNTMTQHLLFAYSKLCMFNEAREISRMPLLVGGVWACD